MAIKGSLKEASIADVFQLLAMGQKTGCLSVTDRSNFGQIYFDGGQLTFAHIVNRRDRLGDLLIRRGLLTHEQLDEAIEQQRDEPERRLGQLLLERELITGDQLERCIQTQIEEAVYYLFTWSRGSFYFEVGQRPEENEILVAINPESLLLEGARRVDEWGLIEKKVPSRDLLFEVERERLRDSDVDLTAEQERLLPLLDGTSTVQELIDETGLVEFDVGKALYGLIQAGFAHRVGQRDAGPADGRALESELAERRNLGVAFYQNGMLEDAAREFDRVVELHPEDVGARFHLALVALRRGDEREAIRRLKSLLEQAGPRYGAFVDLALALGRLGRFEDALLALDEAEALRPESPRIALVRAEFQLHTGDAAAAGDRLEEYRERLGAKEGAAAAYYHRAALVAALTGRRDAARRTTEQGLEEHADSAPLLLLAGAISERDGDVSEAARLYGEAAEADPALAQAHKNMGDIAYRNGAYDEALVHYERVVGMDPDVGDDVYTKLGNIRYKQNAREQAVDCWRRALELNPENEVVRNNLEVVNHAVG